MIKLPSDTPGNHLMLRLQVLIGMANGIIMGYNGIKFDQMTTYTYDPYRKNNLKNIAVIYSDSYDT